MRAVKTCHFAEDAQQNRIKGNKMTYFVNVTTENSAYTFVANSKEEAEKYAEKVKHTALTVSVYCE